MWPTKEQITETLVRTITRANSIEDISNSFFIKHLIFALTEITWLHIVIAKKIYEGQLVKYAAGAALDDHGHCFGIDRREAAKAQHLVRLRKSSPVTRDIEVPDNFLLTTTPVANNPPIKFTVIPEQRAFIFIGETYTDVLVECDEYGETGNVPSGAINIVAQAGFDSVSDSVLFVRGIDREPDESYRQRILATKRVPARSGTLADYEFYAMEVPGVTKAKAFRLPRGPGTIDIVVWGEGIGIPDDNLVRRVTERMVSVTPADMSGGGITVFPPEEIIIDITIENAALSDDTAALLRDQINSYFVSEKAEDAITIVDLIVTISKVLKNFKLIKPDEDIALTGRQSAQLGLIEIRDGR